MSVVFYFCTITLYEHIMILILSVFNVHKTGYQLTNILYAVPVKLCVIYQQPEILLSADITEQKRIYYYFIIHKILYHRDEI